MNLETYKKIELEKELQKLINEGKTREEAVSILIDEDDLGNANYLIEAYLMPIDEITKEIEKYDTSSPKLDEIKFINELCKRYNVDRKAIIERIQNVRRINNHKSLETPERLKRLKNKRDLLQREKDRLSDKSMDVEEKSMYRFGLGIITIVGTILFYPSSPILVGLIPIAYVLGVPSIRMGLMFKKEFMLTNELVDLGKEIKYLETILKEKDSMDKELNKTEVELSDQKVTILDNTHEYVGIKLNNNNLNYDINEVVVLDEDIKQVEGPTLIKRKK